MSLYPYQSKNVVALPSTYEDNWGMENYSQAASSAEAIRDGSNELIDSQEQSTIEMEDTFGLEFAAVQWLNLVTNAEKLFNQLLHSILLTSDEKEQILRWLCLKQECEECVASDEATSLGEHQRHSLERIEELTEDTEPTEDLSDENGKSTDSQYESDTESDFDSHYPDFEDKLDGYMERFRDQTDQLIRSKLMKDEVIDDTDESLNKLMVITVPSLTPNVHQQGRRKSLHPGSIQVPLSLTDASKKDMEIEESSHSGNSEVKRTDYNFFAHECSSSSIEPYKELKILSSESEAKKNQIRQSISDIEGLVKRLEDIQHTVQIKERFIKDLIKNSDARASAKLKFRKKYIKLEEEYYKARTQIAHAEYALHETKRQGNTDGNREAVMQQKNEIEKYRNLAKHYEKRLKDIGMMRLIAGDSAKKVLELESSLLESKKEIEKVKEQIKEEEDRKRKLELELLEDQERVKALEEKYDLHAYREAEDGSSDDQIKWTANETEKLKFNQEKPKVAQTDKKEAYVKGKNYWDEKRGQLDDKFYEVERKETLREEIRNLRKTKDCLLEQRRSLDEKFRKNKTLSSAEKRTILECDEGIEAIDATIEYKNEIMCGRKSLDREDPQQREEGEQMLMDRLLQLSPDEMRTLLCKYFQKVIDLKESGKKMEQQIHELDHENGNQAWRIQELTQALQTQRIETEREKVAMQRNHQEKLHLMLRHFAEESGSSGTEAKRHMVVANESELNKIKRENKNLKRRLQEMEALMQAAAATRGVMRIRSRSSSPVTLPLKPLPAPPSSASTSKVTREKNKVIIRLNAPKKKSSNKDLVTFCHHK